jgi:hypothetical protein
MHNLYLCLFNRESDKSLLASWHTEWHYNLSASQPLSHPASGAGHNFGVVSNFSNFSWIENHFGSNAMEGQHSFESIFVEGVLGLNCLGV